MFGELTFTLFILWCILDIILIIMAIGAWDHVDLYDKKMNRRLFYILLCLPPFGWAVAVVHVAYVDCGLERYNLFKRLF